MTDLQLGTEYEYQVTLDGAVCWPEPGAEFPPSVLRTPDPGLPLRLAFGSCRIAELPVPRRRWSSPRERRRALADEEEHGPDAMVALALDLRGTPHERWPDLMLLIGDQVYADNPGPATRTLIEQRRDPSEPPGYEVADFGEYCFLYQEAWTEPSVRWLLSVVPTAMIFDDHDVHDDWNTSAAWRRDYQAKPWWPDRIRAAYMSYWIYQHLGNLSPAELAKNEMWQQMQEPGDQAGPLGDFAAQADRLAPDIQWSYRRTFGPPGGAVRIVVIDSRSGRVLEEGRRRMVGEAEWQWVTESVAGDWNHVVLASSLPLLLPYGIHGLEAWNEAVCGGAWASASRAPASGSARSWTWNTGRRSAGRSASSKSCSPGWRRGPTAARPPRSPCSAATSTTATWPRWTSRAALILAARSTRPSARRSTMCCRTSSGAGSS